MRAASQSANLGGEWAYRRTRWGRLDGEAGWELNGAEKGAAEVMEMQRLEASPTTVVPRMHSVRSGLHPSHTPSERMPSSNVATRRTRLLNCPPRRTVSKPCTVEELDRGAGFAPMECFAATVVPAEVLTVLYARVVSEAVIIKNKKRDFRFFEVFRRLSLNSRETFGFDNELPCRPQTNHLFLLLFPICCNLFSLAINGITTDDVAPDRDEGRKMRTARSRSASGRETRERYDSKIRGREGSRMRVTMIQEKEVKGVCETRERDGRLVDQGGGEST